MIICISVSGLWKHSLIVLFMYSLDFCICMSKGPYETLTKLKMWNKKVKIIIQTSYQGYRWIIFLVYTTWINNYIIMMKNNKHTYKINKIHEN